MAGRQGWIELTKVRDSERGINRHVEDAGGKRQPRLLKSPEATECAADPDVEAAIFGSALASSPTISAVGRLQIKGTMHSSHKARP